MIITLTTTLIIHKLSGRSNVVHSLIYNLKHYLLWIPEVKPWWSLDMWDKEEAATRGAHIAQAYVTWTEMTLGFS